MDKHTECPAIEVLEQYMQGLLPEGEAREFQAHLEECGLCSLTVERLKEFAAVAAEVNSEPDWARMEARLELECGKAGGGRDTGRKGRGWWRGGSWVAALGYALALILLYPAWVGIARRPASEGPVVATVVAPPRLVVSAASMADLNTTRDQQGLPVVTGRAGEQAVVLSFFVRGLPGTAYVASILDQADKVVVEAGEIWSYDGKGNYCLVVEPRALRVGRHRLVVREKDRPAANPSSFEFERR